MPDARETLHQCMKSVRDVSGRLDPEWGSVQQHGRDDRKWDAAGGPDTLRAMYAERLDEKDDHLTVVAGDGLYYLIEWTADGRHNIQGTHQYGSHMTDASSPHYLDQAEDFSREMMRSPGSTLRTDLRSLGATPSRGLKPRVGGYGSRVLCRLA